jgi:betaine-homocysteine S-methyltransferase
MFEEQVGWAIDEGVDFFIAETFNHFGEARIATEVIKAVGYPALVSFSAKGDKSYDDVGWAEACRRLADAGADVVGLNCGRGPQTMLPLLKEIRAAVDGYVVGQPVAYRTTPEVQFFQNLKDPQGNRSFPVALDPHTLTRFEMADYAIQAHALGINYIGVCCGGAPHYVRAMAEALGRTVPASKYSPDLSLHPVLGAQGDQQAKMARYIQDFQE